MNKFLSFEGMWEFEVFGNGDEILLAFHGFDNHNSDFKVFEPSLGKRFKIVSFNLPFHGQFDNLTVPEPVEGQDKEIIYNKEDLKELFEKFLALNSIKSFSLMGYSLGGKLALQMIELFPERVNSVILFAPDGIQNKWEYGFVTKTALGKGIFKRIINDPSRFFKIVKLLSSATVISPKLSEFVHHQLRTREKRQLVWDVWRCFRDIKPNIKNIQQIINSRKINMQLFFGRYDSVIPPSIGKKFVSELNDKKALHIIDAGHNLIRDKTNDYLNGLF